MKNSKAILGAVSLVLYAYAEAQAGAGVLQPQHVNSTLASVGVSSHAALNRPGAKIVSAKNRRRQQNAFAYSPTTSTAHIFGFAAMASRAAVIPNGQSRQHSASPRGPPIS